MVEEKPIGQRILEGVPMGGSDLFSNFMALFFDPVMSFCEGAEIWDIKTERTKWSDMQNAYEKSNAWYGYNIKVDWQPKFPERPLIPEKPKKPEYSGIGETSLINSYWIGDKIEAEAKRIGIYNHYKEELKGYKDNLDKILESLPLGEQKKLRKYTLQKPFNYIG
ncbi:MAG: hypothetical protein DRP10_01865 [Candidatus Aenigmatarchaeota archaeon]|nr:MAG: hypothetical protein DRP10_01865 [Candidatus Aenigmarchaeota archaeon]